MRLFQSPSRSTRVAFVSFAMFMTRTLTKALTLSVFSLKFSAYHVGSRPIQKGAASKKKRETKVVNILVSLYSWIFFGGRIFARRFWRAEKSGRNFSLFEGAIV